VAKTFDIDHETGDISQYSTVVYPDGDEFAAAARAAICKSSGVQVDIDDQDSIYGERMFTQLSTFSFLYRFYFYPNSLTMALGEDED
jgi:hypothetical protein